MKKIAALFAVAVLAIAPAAVVNAQGVAAAPGKMVYAPGGKRLAVVNRVGADGSPSIILDGRIVTIPASTLTVDGDKLVTSLTLRELHASN